MAGVNKVILVGNLGKDPEVRHLDNDLVMAKLTIATSESIKDKSGNRVEQTEWHNVVLWRRLAEVAEKYLRKGNQVYIEGRIKTRSYDDKDGNKRYITEIQAEQMTMLGSKRDNEGASDNGGGNNYQRPAATASPAPQPDPMDNLPGNFEDDLPF